MQSLHIQQYRLDNIFNLDLFLLHACKLRLTDLTIDKEYGKQY